jgi:hypothetical protein
MAGMSGTRSAEQTGESLAAATADRWECSKAGWMVGCSAALWASTWAVEWVFQKAVQKEQNSVDAKEILLVGAMAEWRVLQRADKRAAQLAGQRDECLVASTAAWWAAA